LHNSLQLTAAGDTAVAAAAVASAATKAEAAAALPGLRLDTFVDVQWTLKVIYVSYISFL